MNRIIKTILSAGIVCLAGLLALQNSALAQTPDTQTPANEGICDILIGATPGLYGLCNAYCEAQDLDDFDKEPPSTKILANYNKKKQAGDPDMPCVHVPCPCWTDEQLASIHADGQAVCEEPVTGVLKITNTTLDISLQHADVDTRPTHERCVYEDRNIVPRIFNPKGISAEEAQACYSAVAAACSSL